MRLIRSRRAPVEPFDVLLVCTGNICRSPMAAALLSEALPELTVRSAGTAAPVGEPWHEHALAALAEVGIDVQGKARRLQPADVRGAALVLTAEGLHRGVVVGADPTAEGRCYTLLEAARLARAAPPAAGLGADGLAAHLAAALGANPVEVDDDLADPVFGDLDDFRVCRDRIRDALNVLAPALGRRPA